MGMVSRERLAEVFVEMADTLVDDFDVIEFMQRVSERTAELVDVAAVGVLLADPRGRLGLVAASDEPTRVLELFQLQVHEGPCLDAFAARSAVVNVDLQDAAARWPSFGARAAASGFRLAHAIPLRLRSEVIGALNLFSARDSLLADEDVTLVQALADVATIGLLQERTIRRGEELTEQLQGALNSRVILEQAKGMLSATLGIDVEESFARIRRYARDRHLKLGDVAIALVTDPGSVPELTGHPQP